MAGGVGLNARVSRWALLFLLGSAFASGLSLAQAILDANRASLADIERIQGIGTTVAANLIDERDKAPFEDWNDLIRRVKGVGAGNAARLSAQGLTVNGAAYRSAQPGSSAPAAPPTPTPTPRP